MKKVLLLMIATLFLLTLSACNNEPEPEDKFDKEETKVLIIDMLELFGAPIENTDFDSAPDFFLGNVHYTAGDRDEYITSIKGDSDHLILLEFVLEKSPSRNQIKVWNIMIGYADIPNRVGLELDYYHRGYMDGEVIDINFEDFGERLQALTIEDVQDILNELGYREAKQ